MAKFYANKAYGRHMDLGASSDNNENDDNARPEGAGQEEKMDYGEGDAAKPDIHITSHAGGHTLHVLPKDGSPAHTQDFEDGDHDSVGETVKGHLGGAKQDDPGDMGSTRLEPTTAKLNVKKPA